ncbi:MAG: TIGR02584 family CRISPR-associated protein, partial [Proteobacteria bacterium]|nr:TIGR02584 family CRISPR-associated protein [Pseudomonadota bacterium]
MKNILLAVTGMTPQVITETLYALHQNNQAVDEIHIITTRNGKEKIYSQLIGGPQGHFYRYLEEYGFEKNRILFDHSRVHGVTDEYGNELEDIVSAHDNERLLARCLDLAFQLTLAKNTAIFFSVAGGRKTMSSCLTLAAQLYGRPQDRLYHVLVTPEFESNRDFFYPPRISRKIELHDPKGLPYYKETRFARVTLVPIPFISIRGQLSSDQLQEPKDPATLMLSLIKEEDPCLTVNLPLGKISFKTLELDLMPSHMALYAFFAMQKKQCPKKTDTCAGCHDCFMDISALDENRDAISTLYQKLCGTRPITEMSTTGIAGAGLTTENFRSLRSKINKALLVAFGPHAAGEL